MTTTEFMIGRSADDAIERKEELRKIFWALLAAMVLHVIVGVGIAISHGWFSSPITVEEDKPVELTIVQTATPPPTVPKNPMFMETDPTKQSAHPPDQPTFESNADSVGASEAAANGNLPLPSQNGKDRPFIDLETHDRSLAMQGAQPQPNPQSSVAPSPSAAPSVQPSVTPMPDQLAMLKATPTPQPAARQQQAASSYRAQKEQTRMTGSINNRGVSAVNAKGTPLGRYQKEVYDAIGSRWYYYVEQRREMVDIGTARVSFSVDRSGRVRNLKMLQNSSNETFANVCIQSVQEVKLKPIPPDVADTLPSEGLESEISFTMIPQ